MFRLRCNETQATIVYFCITVLVFMDKTCATSFYTTPASDRQFYNFPITDEIPEQGKITGGELQDPVTIIGDLTNGGYVIFEFKGLGNALILLHSVTVEGPLNDVFLMEIGGEMDNNRVGIYDSSDISGVNTNRLSSITVPDITNVNDYRYYWILWVPNTMSIHVGTGHEIYENEILSANTSDVTPRVYLDKISVVSISTTISNIGHWRFNNPPTVLGTTSSTAHTPTTFTRTTRLPLFTSTTETSTAPPTNLATASNTVQRQITFTQRTYITLPSSTTELLNPKPTNILSTHIQPSVELASKSINFTSTELKTLFHADTTQVTVDVLSFSNPSDNLTAYSNLTTNSMRAFSTSMVNDVVPVSFFDKPGNVAAVGVLVGAAGLSSVGMVGYLLTTNKCSKRNIPSAL